MTSFNDLYVLGKQIGKGGFGKVYGGIRRCDGLSVAIKFIAKRRVVLWHTVGEKRVPLELVLLQRLQSISSVIRLVEHFEFSECFVLVMERLDGVDMFDYINEQTYLDEPESQRLFAQILHTVMECHHSGIVHRDIKDENIIVERKTGKIKLIDFGSGAFLNTNDDFYQDFEGTRVYAPPEWIGSRKYKAESSTVWQLGILLFDMVFGNIPFETDTQILNARLTWYRPISKDCRDLISQCLRINASERPTLAEMAQHRWIAASMKALEPERVTEFVIVEQCCDHGCEYELSAFSEGACDSPGERASAAMDSTTISDVSSGYSSSSASISERSESSFHHVNSDESAIDTSFDESSPNWLPKFFSSTFSCVQTKMHEMGIM